MKSRSARHFRKDLAFAAALAGITLAYYAPVLFGGGVLPAVDASRFFFPVWAWAARSWGGGILPLWNPDMGCGSPFACDPQTASFYLPLRLAYAVFPPVRAFHSLIALHHAWSLVGFWAYGRSRGWSRGAVLAGAVSFGFSSAVTAASWTPVALFSISWIPWVFLAGERAFRGARRLWPVLTVATALQASAGYPVLAFLTGVILWVTLLSEDDGASRRPGCWVRLALSQGAAVLMQALWLLPFLEILPYGGVSIDGPMRSQCPAWGDLTTFLDPFLNGHPLKRGYGGPPFWVASYFIGLPAFLLVLAAFAATLFKKVFSWKSWLPLGAALWLSLGETGYLAAWLKAAFPPWNWVVRSGFMIPIVAFLAASWAARTLNRLSAALCGLGPLAVGLLAASCLVSLAPPALSLRWTMPESFYGEEPGACRLPGLSGRVYHTPAVQDGFYRLQGRSLEEAYRGAKACLAPNWPLLYGRAEVVSYNTFSLRMPRWWTQEVFKVSPSMSRKALDYLGAGTLIGGGRWPDLHPLGEAVPGTPILANPSAYPSWFAVEEGLWAPDPRQEWSLMEDKHWDFRRVAFLEEPEGMGRFDVGKVAMERHGANRLQLDAIGGGKLLLVSSEAAAPGWKAAAPGSSLKPLVVHHAFRGVVLPDGQNHVAWSYEPATFRLGLFLTLLSCAGVLAWPVWMRRRTPGRGPA